MTLERSGCQQKAAQSFRVVALQRLPKTEQQHTSLLERQTKGTVEREIKKLGQGRGAGMGQGVSQGMKQEGTGGPLALTVSIKTMEQVELPWRPRFFTVLWHCLITVQRGHHPQSAAVLTTF